MAKTPMVAVHHSLGRDPPVWGQAFSSAHFSVSDDSETRGTAIPSSIEDSIPLRASRSMPCGGTTYVYKQEPPPLFKPPHPRPGGLPSSYFIPETLAQNWKSPGSPTAYAAGAQCFYGRCTSGRSSIVSLVPSEDAHMACQTHIVKQTSLPGKVLPISPQTSKVTSGTCVAERVFGPDERPGPSVRRVEHPVVFSAFFDRMKLDHLVAAKDKILQSLAGRCTEGSLHQQSSFEPAPHSSRSAEGLTTVDPAVQVLGGVDLGVLYSRYQKSEEGRASVSDRDTTSASQATAEPSPPGSDSEGELPVSRERVFRTEAAARLAASPALGKVASHAASGVGLRVVGLWPKQAERQQPACRHGAAKVAEQPKSQTPKAADRRACRISHRRSGDAQGPPELRDAISPRYVLSAIAQETPYTHIIPVSKSGSPKGLVRNKTSAFTVKGRKTKQVAARVVEANEYRFFVFNIPDCELIRTAEFQLTSCISQGSFGTVYRAKWKGGTVAVKQAHGKMTLEAMRSVAREINSYRMIEHPFIVKYYGVCLEYNFVALVTEYLNGGNIFDILFENKVSISAAIRLKMCRQLLEAVHFLHTEKRLVHRDLKTANLVVDGQVSGCFSRSFLSFCGSSHCIGVHAIERRVFRWVPHGDVTC